MLKPVKFKMISSPTRATETRGERIAFGGGAGGDDGGVGGVRGAGGKGGGDE